MSRKIRIFALTFMLQLLLELVKGSCSLFDIITTPDSGTRTIFQDFSTSSSQDYGFGVWTRYSTQYEDIPNLSIQQMNMFVLSDNSDQSLQFIYYITINRSDQTMIHSLVRMLDSAFLIHELKLNMVMIGNNWVYFYFCFSQSMQIYNIFLYINGNQENVQMQQEGPVDIQYYEQREYALGGFIELPETLKTSIIGGFQLFAGEISDLDLKIGDSYFYEDIETFLDNLDNLNCQYYQCPNTIQQIKITDFQLFDSSSADLQLKIAYYQSKFTLKGWVLLQELDENQSLESVLFRASLRKNYYDDLYQGDKALYWKYYQSTQYNSQNGFIFTTYHNQLSELVGSYQTSNSDSWILKNENYKDSITNWHYFIFQEGIEGQDFNIQLQVYFGYTRNTLNLQMTQNHYDHSIYYFTFGGDKFNSNFRGEIRNITFTFCYDDNQQFSRECHYSCKTCFGPLSNHCIDCADYQTSKRIAKDGVCVCDVGYVDTGDGNCQDKQLAFKYVDIMEEIDQNILNCLYGEFQVTLNGTNFCLQCPGQINNYMLECIDCIMNPLTWYLNPICINDYFQPIIVEDSNYVFLQKERNQIDYDFFLINLNTQLQIPEIQKCIGCKQLNDALIKNFIQKYHLNKLMQVECKTCYKSVNNECFKVNQNCLECDDNQFCIKCNNNSTLFDNSCIKCPEYCPNCFVNQTGSFCNECVDGYYYNSTLQTCQQCGLNCQTCIYSVIHDQLLCLKCIDVQLYFISADFSYCGSKNLDNCLIQGYEQSINPYQNSTYPNPATDFYINSLDVRTDNLSQDIYKVCFLCEDGFVNQMFIFKDYRCVHYDDVNLLDLPKELKEQVKQSTNSSFQLAFTDYPTLHYGIIYGDQVIVQTRNASNHFQMINVTYSSVIDSINFITPGKCSDSNCEECIKNYLQSLEFCLKCKHGFYSSFFTGNCYKCPSDCDECRQEYKYYNDAWKWDLLPYYIFRSNIQSGIHNFSYYSSSQDIVNYQPVCTKCPNNGYIQKGKCYPDCGCKTCIFQDGKSVCLECANDTQTYENGECINCPSSCSICKQLDQNQIFAKNPYFSPIDQATYKYAKQCLKAKDIGSQDGFIYHDISLGLAVHCQQQKECYKLLEISLNLYCDDQRFNDDILQQDADNRVKFLSENIKLSDVFSTQEYTHFRQIENGYLYQELNENTVKLVRFILKFSPSETNCQIKDNTFVKTSFQENVYSLKFIELVFQQSSDIPLIFPKNVKFYNFTKVTLNNIHISSQQGLIQIGINNFFSITSLNVNNLIIENCQNLDFSILIENPKLIEINNINIANSVFNNFSGFIQYKFRENFDDSQLQVLISNVLIQDSKFFSSVLFLQLVGDNQKNQILSLNSFNSKNNQYQNSIVVYTDFQTTERSSQVAINGFQSEFDQLISSSFCTLYGALSTNFINIIVQNGIFSDSSRLFVLPLFVIQNLFIKNNRFKSLQSRTITNVIQPLYSDNITINKVSLSDAYFQYNQYEGSQVFLELIISQNFQNLEAEIKNIEINSNILNNANDQSFQTLTNSSFYFKLQKATLTNIKIIRAFSFSEFSFNNLDQLFIQQLTANMNSSFSVQLVNYNLICINDVQEIGMGSLISLFNVSKVEFTQMQITNVIAFNQPVIQIKSLLRSNQRLFEQITFQESKFLDNTLIKTRQEEQPAIISIISEQDSQINLITLTFENNQLHNYYENQQFLSSSTILVQNTYSNITLVNSAFSSNIVTNSISSNLVFITNNASITQTNFSQQNKFNYDNFKKRLIWGFDETQTVYVENLMYLFPIKSKGGNGYMFGQQFFLKNIQSDNSLALEGGAFYFITQSNGQIIIDNSVFNSTSVELSNQVNSKGGLLYIDASQSNLDFTFSNNEVYQSYSRAQGGVFYFEPSRTSSSINVEQSNFFNIYSLFSSFFYLPVSFSSQNLVLKITFSTLTIKNEFGGYLEYLGQLDEITDKEIKQIYLNNLIYIQQGQISFKYINIYDIFQYGLMNIEYPSQVTIDNLQVRNITLVNQKMIEIIFNKKKSTTMIIKNTEFETITEYEEEIIKPTYSLDFQEQITPKCSSNQVSPNSLAVYFNYSNSDKRSKLNFYAIISNQQNKTILHIDQVSQQQKISMNQISFNFISCSNCIQGMFSITNIDNQKQTSSINCENLQFQNSLCGTSCLALSNKDVELPILNSNLRVLQSSESNSQQLSFTVSILDSSFKNNSASYGGSLLVQSVDLQIQNCEFVNNNALQGGAIYLSQNQGNQFYITSSFIANNTAEAGGGIFLNNYTINSKQVWNNIFSENSAKMYGSNIADFPTSLTIKMKDAILFKKIEVKNATNITETIQIKEYKIGNSTYQYIMLPSGQKLKEYKLYNEKYQNYTPLNLTLRIIALNSIGDQIQSLDNSFCNILSRKIIDGVQTEFSQNFTSYNTIHFNSISQDYNLDDLVVQFDPNLQGYLQLQFDCNSVKIPIFQNTAPYLLSHYFTNYRLWVNIKTFPCQRGEYQSDDGVCKECDKNYDQYSLVAGQKCQLKDSLTMEDVSSARIKLRPYYWRPFEQSQNIEYCKNYPDNCIGGWDAGNQLCAYSHIGALCEQCDLYNVRGDGEFSVSSQYKCGSCNNVGDNATKIVLISIWTMISIFFSVKGTVETVQNTYLQSRFTKIFSLVEDRKLGYGSILLKVLTNYLQIVGIIATFQLQLPTAFQSSIKAVGSPVDTMSYSQDCLLVKMSNLEIIYFRLIWALIMPLIYSSFFGIFYSLAIIFKFIKYNRSVLTTTLIYLFIYLQPTLLGGFISLLSYRKISDVQWIQGNVSYQYDTSVHKIWMYAFILPLTIILAVLIPFYMFMSLYSLRSKLNSEESRKSWGYLYNEYQQNAYFWEIIKILQKGFIIVFLTFYEDLIIIKASLAFLILFLYMFLTKKFIPYKLSFLNLIDEMSTLICGASIVLAMTIYQANISDNQEIIWPFYIFLIAINLIFLAIILWEILLTQLEENQEKLDQVRKVINQKYPKLITKNFFFKKLLTNRTRQQRRVKRRFKLIKYYLLQIVRKYPGIYKMPESAKSQTNLNDNEPKFTGRQTQNYKITQDISKLLEEDKQQTEQQQQQQTVPNDE